MNLSDKTIVIGICGGIASYKIADLVSRLRKAEATVEVVMTRAAQSFIPPFTLATLAGRAVHTDQTWWASQPGVLHIELAKKADIVLIAPATANCIAKIAHGVADDLLTTLVLATKAPIFLAPAMNVNMFENSVVQSNLSRLTELGYSIIDPGEGIMACGDTGKGRLPEIDVLLDHINKAISRQHDLTGLRVLVTAGGTREALDPVRYISNRSTGRMGYAVAAAAVERGAAVTLISAPTGLPPVAGTDFVSVTSALDMYRAVFDRYDDCDIVIKAAAVADYRPKHTAVQKIKKGFPDLTIHLERNPDILQELGLNKKHQLLVGFAAETENVELYAKDKLHRKKLDMIVANDVSRTDAGFAIETNIVTFFFPDGKRIDLPEMTKKEVAHKLLDEIIGLVRSN